MTTAAVCIPTIAPRRETMLRGAVRSVMDQTRAPDELLILSDLRREGPSAVRDRLTRAAETEWVAYLDDDDRLYPEHLERLLGAAEETGADLIYPWFDITYPDGTIHNNLDPLKIQGKPAFGRPFDDVSREEILGRSNFIPVTVLVRRELVIDVGGWPVPMTLDWPADCCEDWGLWQRLLEAGARFHHVPERTWSWQWHGGNTSGRPDRWETGVPT